jgi:hypothetical protein
MSAPYFGGIACKRPSASQRRPKSPGLEISAKVLALADEVIE